MPVDLLLCEGRSGGPDVRILKKLLAGHCGEIRPMGGKYGMGSQILSRREALGSSKIAGLLDGDFLPEWVGRLNKPRNWLSSDGIRFGWRWERKEIENFIVDPTVVSLALGESAPPYAAYVAQLKDAANRIATYAAARTALSSCRKRFQDLPASWGPTRGREKHPFPDNFSIEACSQGIKDTVAQHTVTQVIKADDVMMCFERLLPEFQAGGARQRDFIATFAGKDLLLAIDEAFLRNSGFQNAGAFKERILLGIEGSADDIVGWVQEWEGLRQEVLAF